MCTALGRDQPPDRLWVIDAIVEAAPAATRTGPGLPGAPACSGVTRCVTC